jgi:transcriptional regulator with XRE-family HTH domain
MGSPRQKPERLAEKLKQIRLSLGLSQDGMLERLGLTEEFFRSRVSAYELGNREPPLQVLLKYARLVGLSADVLIDDELDLPDKLLSPTKGKSVRRRKRR